MHILVDGDIIKYRVGFAGQHAYYDIYACTPDEEYFVRTCENAKEANAWLKTAASDVSTTYVRKQRIEADPVENVLHSIKVVMEAIRARFDVGGEGVHMTVYFSCSTPENWRTKLYPEYKANRKNQVRPVHYEAIGRYMNQMYSCITGVDDEADDLISEQAAWEGEVGSPYVVVTIDKDMDQIPGRHYNWVKEDDYEVDALTAKQFLCVQSIMGDSTDNIKGIPGWGNVAATEWMMQCAHPNIEDIVLAAYETAEDKQGNPIYTPAEASYHAELNTALVTLPTCTKEREFLERGVTNARKKMQAAETDSAESHLVDEVRARVDASPVQDSKAG